MVHCNLILLGKNIKLLKKFKPSFIDTLRLTIKGGHGGNGLPKYGGVGGQGGCVYFVAKENATLHKILKKYPDKKIIAGHGEDSSKMQLLGRRGIDRKVDVPVGVTVWNNGKLLSELNDENSECIVAGGGGGGCTGNSFLGHKGQDSIISLDLKLIADVGLVGFPNAGKSTLLKALSKASPKIASYPFTTIHPQIGTIEYDDYRQITVADLPGLIEGAHQNKGMGHKFLKHIERTRLLLMVVDIFGFRLSAHHSHQSCLENIVALTEELKLYNEDLLQKPCVLLLNKIDDDHEKSTLTTILKNIDSLKENEKILNFEKVISISAKENLNIQQVKNVIREVLDEHAEKNIEQTLKPTKVLKETFKTELA